MKDGIIKGDGTSRKLRANFPATYDEFKALAAAANLPVDVLFNESGWQVLPDFLNKANLLQDNTCDMLGISRNSVVNDALVKITLGDTSEAYVITLLTERGAPASGYTVTGIVKPISGKPCITDENGVCVGVPSGESSGRVTIGVTSDYIDKQSISQEVVSTGLVTAATITLPDTEYTNYVAIDESKEFKFSPEVDEADFCAIGGGASGGFATSQDIAVATGGGGGYLKNLFNVKVSSTDVFSATVGAGGASTKSTYFEASGPGNNGGTTTLRKNSSSILSALGGYAGRARTNQSDTSETGGAGGSGGGGSQFASSSSYTAENAAGGSNGSSGASPFGGVGSGESTHAFGDESLPLFCGGGGGAIVTWGPNRQLGPGGAGGGGQGAAKYQPPNNSYGGSGSAYGGGGGGASIVGNSISYSYVAQSGAGYKGAILVRWRYKEV